MLLKKKFYLEKRGNYIAQAVELLSQSQSAICMRDNGQGRN